eukprot:m.7195 g.7195  ORF g.7195 m.7195 type:complete len:133 (+) comp17990_c0_seq1:1247-1645(+)
MRGSFTCSKEGDNECPRCTPPPSRPLSAPQSPIFRLSAGAHVSVLYNRGSSPVLLRQNGRFWGSSVKQALPPRPPSPIPSRSGSPCRTSLICRNHRLESLDEDDDDDESDDFMKEETTLPDATKSRLWDDCN